MTPGERALRHGAAVVDAVPRVVFTVTGERPLAYLHDVLAQDVADLAPGSGAIAAVLDAGGRVAAEVRVLVRDADVLLDGEPAVRPGVDAHIARHAPLAGCEVRDETETFAVAAVRGPDTDDALSAAALPVPPKAEASFAMDGDVIVVRVVWGVPGVDLIGPPALVADAIARMDAEGALFEELVGASVEAGRPRYGVDITDDLLVNETPLLARGVSMTKGCYPGQESVARIANLGRVRRSVRGLQAASALTPGATVGAGDIEAGTVTSAARVPGDGWKALAILRDTASPGDTVVAGVSEAIVVALE